MTSACSPEITVTFSTETEPPENTVNRAALLKPLADEAKRILDIGKATGDSKLLHASSEILFLLVQAI